MAVFQIKQPSSRLGATQNLAVSTTSGSTASTVVGAQTYQLLLTSTVACYIAIANSPTVTTSTGTYLPANFPEFFTCAPGQQVVGVTSTGSGVLSITEVS